MSDSRRNKLTPTHTESESRIDSKPLTEMPCTRQFLEPTDTNSKSHRHLDRVARLQSQELAVQSSPCFPIIWVRFVGWRLEVGNEAERVRVRNVLELLFLVHQTGAPDGPMSSTMSVVVMFAPKMERVPEAA